MRTKLVKIDMNGKIRLPSKVLDKLENIEYFKVELLENGKILLTPVRLKVEEALIKLD